jgi:hypothetical protein
MSICNRELNPFQQRHAHLVAAMLGFSVAISSGVPALFGRQELSDLTQLFLGLLAAGPIVGTMIVIARYLRGETDEYLRSLVVRSILWGFGAVMVSDTLIGAIVEYHPHHAPFGLFNMDIFVVTSMIALRIQLWRNR